MIHQLDTIASATMEIPVGWVLSSFAALASIIATLATSLYQTLKASIETLKQRIIFLERDNEDLRGDVERMSKGCGVDHCMWKNRQ